MTGRKVFDPDVPLFLIASAIAHGVKQRGGKLYRISVARTAEHQYRIRFKCRARDARERVKTRYRSLYQQTLERFDFRERSDA
jgi:hypothetical protein